MALLVLLVVPLAVATVFAARLFLRQDRLIFRPGPVLERSPSAIGIPHEQLRLSVDGTSVDAWWIPGRGGAPVVIYFHGSEGNLTHELPVVHFLHSLGVHALLPEYVGYLSAERPSEHGCYLAAAAAWDCVTQARGFPEQQVIVFGHSLGGCVAARTAAGRDCAGLVVLSGFTSVRELAARTYPYLPVKPFVRTRMDALDAVRDTRCATLVIHSRDDEHVPFEEGVRLYEEARAAKKLVPLNGSHFGHAWRHSAEVDTAWRELLARDFRTWQ